MKAVEDDVAILKRAMQGGWADDGVTWQDGLAQTMQSLTESVVALKNDRKALFALLGMTTIATSATAIHGTGIWQTILQFFGGH
jgi:hypothetical protein